MDIRRIGAIKDGPEVAMIVVVPFVTEVTRPEVEMVATAASDVAHVTQALAIVAPS
jgi:hypothetical protein